MSTLKTFLISLIGVFLFSTGCTEAPLNDLESKKAPVKLPLDLNTTQEKNFNQALDNFKPTKAGEGASVGDGSPEEIKLREENLRKPIIYGVGAGGVTLDTTLQESKREPIIIFALGGYLGSLAGGPKGPINMQTKFTEYRSEGGLERLSQDLYNAFEKPESEDYNCLEQGTCTLIVGDKNQANVVIVLPGAAFLIAKEEFQVAQIRIIRANEPGPLNSGVDLLSGSILVPDSTRKLGDTYSRITEGLEDSQPQIFPSPGKFLYNWNGVLYGFKTNNFSNDAEKAESRDIAELVSLSPPYPGLLTADGTPIIYKVGGSTLEFELAATSDNEEDSQEQDPLKEEQQQQQQHRSG